MMLGESVFSTFDGYCSWNDLSDAPMVEYTQPGVALDEIKKSLDHAVPSALYSSIAHISSSSNQSSPPSFQAGPSQLQSLHSLSTLDSFDSDDWSDLDDVVVVTFEGDDELELVGGPSSYFSAEPTAFAASSVSWEDDLFGAGLAIPESLEFEKPKEEETEAKEEKSKEKLTAVTSLYTKCRGPSSAPRKAEKKKTPRSRKTSRKRKATTEAPAPTSFKKPSPFNKKAPAKPVQDHKSPGYVSIVVVDPSQSNSSLLNSLPAEPLSLARPLPQVREGKIGLVSSATHSVSEAALRSMFQTETVVSLSRAEEGDEDEEIDIL